MTKTPEELTLNWAAGRLEQDKDYYVEIINDDIVIDFYGQLFDNPHYPQNLGFDNVSNNIIKRILAPVPTYDEYKAMQDQIADASKKVEELRDLLKDIKLFFEECNPHDFTVVSDNMDFYLPRINAVLDDNKI